MNPQIPRRGGYSQAWRALVGAAAFVLLVAGLRVASSLLVPLVVAGPARLARGARDGHLLGVDFAVLWGLLAFLFNYVPNFGSILAAVPPVFRRSSSSTRGARRGSRRATSS